MFAVCLRGQGCAGQVAAERPRLLQSPAEDVGLTESKRKMRALIMARTSPSLAPAALPIWGKPEVPPVF